MHFSPVRSTFIYSPKSWFAKSIYKGTWHSFAGVIYLKCLSANHRIQTFLRPASSAVHVIPSTGNLELTFTANKQNCGIRFLEHVQVKMNLVFPGRGRLKMTAESPSGTQSQLLYPRTYDSFISRRNFTNWNVTSLHYWGENPAGDWHVRISNTRPRTHRQKGTTILVTLY